MNDNPYPEIGITETTRNMFAMMDEIAQASMPFKPALPYAGKSGHVAASPTSRARAASEDASGVTGRRQKQILDKLESQEYGYTWQELSEQLGLHHGQVSGALSALHNAGWVFALLRDRNASQIYMHYKYRDKYGAAQRLDSPALTRSSVKNAAIDALALAVATFLDCRTFDHEAQLRDAYNVYNAL